MPISKLKFVKRCAEFLTKDQIKDIPSNTRGIYSLYKENGKNNYDLVYIGIARGKKAGIHSRIKAHSRSQRKSSSWTHFSLFEVHDNVSAEEIEELEGIIRHIYRYDLHANFFNKQRRHKKLINVRNNRLKTWE